MKYEVTIPRIAYHVRIVEAKSAEEALDKALTLLPVLCEECVKNTKLEELDVEGIDVTILTREEDM